MNTMPNQTRTPQLPQDLRKTNKRVSFSTRVISTTSISRLQLKSSHLEDMVMLNNSQVRTKEVEDHRRIYYLDVIQKCKHLEEELSKGTKNVKNKSFNDLSKKQCENQDAPEFPEFFKINELKAQLEDKNIAIKELKKLIAKMKGKSVTRTNVKPSLTKPVTPQTLPNNVNQVQKNTNVLAPGMYKMNTMPNQTRTPQLPQDLRKTNKRVSFSTRVISTTSISRLQLKSSHLEDMVMLNNSQVRTKEVEDHRRIWDPLSPALHHLLILLQLIEIIMVIVDS
nr:hypothetical protein [Tanacetum cinerariifolium]